MGDVKRVSLYQQPGFAKVEAGATVGATIGVNLFDTDGSVVDWTTIVARAGGTGGDTGGGNIPTEVYWRTIREVPDNVAALEEAIGTGLFAVIGPADGAFRAIQGPVSVEVENGDGVAGHPSVQLVGDEAAPGDTAYYGTNGSGDKGWHPVADALAADVDELTKTVDANGVTSFGLADLPNLGDGAFLLFYRDAKGRVSSAVAGTSDDVPEGVANLWFTNERAQDAVGSILADSSTVRFTYDDAANQISAEAPQLVFGQEYLAAFHNKLLAGNAAKMVFSGDSTTFGTGITDPEFILSEAVLRVGLQRRHDLTAVNAGHSGASTEDWRTLYLAGDLASNPDLYVLRWGFNDPFWGRTLEQFEVSLRSALATARASKPVSAMSILLMVPNTSNDTANGRDAAWMEATRPVIRRAARDYQCAFIDTFKLWEDTVNAANLWMDEPLGPGVVIHPLNVMNSWIASKVGELIYPAALDPAKTDIHATLSADQVFSTGALNTLVCDTEVRDARGEYNPATGTFTVQQSGKYLLNCSAYVDLTTQDRTIITMISVNGSEAARLNETTLYGSILATGGASGGTSILDLSAGDEVTFQTFVFIPSPSTYTVKNYPYTTYIKVARID